MILVRANVMLVEETLSMASMKPVFCTGCSPEKATEGSENTTAASMSVVVKLVNQFDRPMTPSLLVHFKINEVA